MIAIDLLLTHRKIEAAVTMLAYSATTLSLLGDVIGRELFETGIWGAQRFAVYAAIVAGFLGMSLAAAEGEHIRPQIFDAVFPEKLNKTVNRIADFLSFVVYILLAFLAVKFVLSSYENSEIAAVLDWPLWPIQLILPYAFFAVSCRYFLFAFSPSLKSAFLTKLGKAAHA